MQLSIQANAEQQARKLIKLWGERNGVAIADVRYHLLRNGLILQDIRMQQGSDRLRIAQMVLSANPKLLIGSTPRIGRVQVFGLEADLSPDSNIERWQQQEALLQLWRAVAVMDVNDGRVSIHMREGAPPLELHNLRFHQQQSSLMRTMRGTAELQRGRVIWSWDIADRKQSGEGSFSRGRLAWQELDAGAILNAWQLHPVEGAFDGELAWESSTAFATDGTPQKNPLKLIGSVRLDRGADGQQSVRHALELQASEEKGVWQADMHAEGWPLEPWRDLLPSIGEHRFVAGQLAGRLHWQGRPDHWQISSDSGLLQDVTFAPVAPVALAVGEKTPVWYWSRINYNTARLDPAERQLQFDKLAMHDSRLVFDTRPNPDGSRSASTGYRWQINANQIELNNTMVALQLPGGQLMFDRLNGQADYKLAEPLRFELATADSSAAVDDKQRSGVALPFWHLKGMLLWAAEEDQPTAQMSVQGKRVSLSRLRALLPLQDRDQRVVDLSGEGDVNVVVTADHQGWRMSGDGTAHDLQLAYGGDNWKAERMDITFGPVGMGLFQQTIGSVAISGWRYTAAMQPLALHPAAIEGRVQQQPWWLHTLQQHQLVIEQLQAEEGVISIGQPQAQWADHVSLDADNIRSGHWSGLKLSAMIGGSLLQLDGRWLPSPLGHRFLGDLHFADAEPFFLNDWLTASGMPRLLRGRLSWGLSITGDELSDRYQGVMQLRLKQGRMERGSFKADPMLERTGYKTSELLQRLEDAPGVIALELPLQGSWVAQPLTLGSLGLMLQAKMKQQASSGNWRERFAQHQDAAPIEARVRLHKRSRLSLNERNRLYNVIKKLRAEPSMMIELRPRWIGATLSEEMLARIRYTQQLIESYLSHRKIEKERMFPAWPSADDHVDETGAIEVRALSRAGDTAADSTESEAQ